MNHKTKLRKKGKRPDPPTRAEIEKAVEDFLKSGGKITKIESVEDDPNFTLVDDCSHEFLMGESSW